MARTTAQTKIDDAARSGILTVRAGKTAKQDLTPGLETFLVENDREALLYVPTNFNGEQPAPFALMLHGAGGSARHAVDLLRERADDAGIVLLAVKSFYPTWDVIADRYGADVEHLNRALAWAFARFSVDETRLAVGGFSDGASYALSLGVANGDLFSHVIAFSPGFMAPARQAGAPEIFVSHGSQDRVLPIEQCSRKLVPQLQKVGYAVNYLEFDGGHTIPPEVSRRAVEWFVG